MKYGKKLRVGLAILNIVLNTSAFSLNLLAFALAMFLWLSLIGQNYHEPYVLYIVAFTILILICFIFCFSAVSAIVGNSFAICPISAGRKKASYILLVLHLIELSIILILAIIAIILAHVELGVTSKEINDGILMYYLTILIILVFHLFIASLLIALDIVVIILIKKVLDANINPLQVPLIDHPRD